MIIFLISIFSLICVNVIYFILLYHNNFFYKQISFVFFLQLIVIQNNNSICKNNFMSLISFQITLFIYEGIISYGYTNMTSTFAVIGTLIKSTIKVT